MKLKWQRNIWTGNDIASVGPTKRLIRMTFMKASPLYSAEEWGDYSLSFPIRGSWQSSPKAALAALETETT